MTEKRIFGVVFLGLAALAVLIGGVFGLRDDVRAQGPGTGPRWECSLDAIGATLTRCVAAPTSGEARYITDLVMQSTTTTAGLMLLQTGTGANCATSTTSLFPAASAVVRIAYAANSSAPTVISLRTPLRVPPNMDLCLLGTAVNTASFQAEGYVAP